MNLLKNTILLTALMTLFACSENNKTETADQRITTIGRMQSEVEKLENNRTCHSKSIQELVSIEQDLPPRPFEQIIEKCELKNEYTLLKGKYQGLGWGENCTFYLKNDKLFFAFMVYQYESCSGEVRFYYDENGDLIKTTLKSLECSDGEFYKEPTENFDATLKEELQASILEKFEKTNQLLKNQ